MRVLLVDDEPNILAGYQRQLRKQFTLDTASGGEQALQMLATNGPYAAVVTDMRMPGMDGVELLTRLEALAPHTMRLMLTGNVDQLTAQEAVNRGHVYRFLNKPCPPEMLALAIESALAQYQLVISEAELLEKTLVGTISVLTEILAANDPRAFGRARLLRELAREVARTVDYPTLWHLELGALLSPIGRVKLPEALLLRANAGESLTPREQEQMLRVPEHGYKLLAKIPRLEPVADIVLYQNKLYSGAGFPGDALSGDRIPRGARILKVLSDFTDIEAAGTPRGLAFRSMMARNGHYDKTILASVNTHFNSLSETLAIQKKVGPVVKARLSKMQVATPTDGTPAPVQQWVDIPSEELIVGDVLVSDVRSRDGSRLLAAGNIITESIFAKLQSIGSKKGILEPIRVAILEEDAAAA